MCQMIGVLGQLCYLSIPYHFVNRNNKDDIMAKKFKPRVKSRDSGSAHFPCGAEFKQGHELEVYSAIACERNKDQILSVISPIFSTVSNVLEIGSGTGQHAIYFAEKMPHLTWHTSDCQPYLDGINTWTTTANLPNIKAPFELDVSTSQWPNMEVDAVFTADTVHCMHLQDVNNFIKGAGKLLKQQGSLVIYGPFYYNGLFTSENNVLLDQWLKRNDLLSGIKNFEEIKLLADKHGMQLVTDYEMPDDKHILHFIKM